MKKTLIAFLILTFQLNIACSDEFHQQSYLINFCNSIFLKLSNYLKFNEKLKINNYNTVIFLAKDKNDEIFVNVFNLKQLNISQFLTELIVNKADFFNPNDDNIYQKINDLKLHPLSYFRKNNIYVITINNNYYAFELNENFTTIESFLLSDSDFRELDDYIYYNTI